MKSTSEYRALAHDSLNNKWGNVAIMSLVVFAVIALAVGFVQSSTWLSDKSWTLSIQSMNLILEVLLLFPLSYAMSIVMMEIMRGHIEDAPRALFAYFRSDYSRSVPAMLLMTMIVVFASIFTLGIGGIILAYAYSMMPFIVHDHPEISAREALRRSRLMTRGHKWDIFVLDFSFIGWILLCILSCGILTLWVQPWMTASRALMYDDLRATFGDDDAEDVIPVVEVETVR